MELIIWIIILAITIPITLFFVSGLANIKDDEVGIRIRKIFGKQMPQGQIIARTHGDVGIQADVLMPKLYWFNPITWRVHKTPMTEIKPGTVGIIEAIDGEALPHGRLLGDHVECNSYQDAKAFLDNGGKRGPQIEILRPGFYRINTELFKIIEMPVIIVKEKQIGVVVAQDGKPLPSGYIIAPKPEGVTDKTHKYFQDGQSFINTSGYKGPQLDTLQPGEYYINTFLFKVVIADITEVLPGYVAVLRSNIGEELAKEKTTPKPISKKPTFDQPIHEPEEVVLTTDKNERGIWLKPVAPGNYNLNILAFTAYPVPTSAVTIDWASGTETRAEHLVGGKLTDDLIEDEKAKEFFKFSQLRVTSKDGFQLEVDVRMIIRISPEHASFVIARFGSVANLIEQIVHPLIDSSFRNKAGEKKAIDFIMSRTDLQKEALEKAKGEFDKYHVEAQNLLIAYIKVDEKLLATQTEKELAIQQQTQFEQQALAQEKRIAVKEKEARAEMQPKVIEAKLAIEIQKDLADAARQEAGGIRDKTKYIAEGDSYKQQIVGEGIAKGYKAQTDVIGMQNLTVIQLLKEISSGNIKITPDTYVGGGSGDTSMQGLFMAWLVNMVKQTPQDTKQKQKRLPEPSMEKGKEAIPSSIPEIPKIPKSIDNEPETDPERIKQLNEEIEKDARQSDDDEPAIIRRRRRK